MMDFSFFKLLAIFVSVNTVLAGYGDLRLYGGDRGRLEFQQRDGRWGTVCNVGFDSVAIKVTCRQLGYYDGEMISPTHYDYDTWLPVAVCLTHCTGHERQLSKCVPKFSCSKGYCSHDDDVYIQCRYNDYDSHYYYTEDTEHYDSSSGAIIVSSIVVAVLTVVVVTLLIICLVYIRRSFLRRQNNRTYIVTQQRRPRILVARVTRTTVPSGPPPPPPYTPTQPTNDYTPVPPRGYQPVATDDYTTTPTAPFSDVPSEPPPEYTPRVSTDDVPILTVQ
ncbi:uncharacterized protein [Dysidea avara]|uniref:uncharacterized protein n=1 Tax=Dysidea avara TaxID=196820 RepID=UPI00332C1C07